MVSYSGKQFDGFLDKKPCNYHDPAIELLGIYPPEKNKKTKKNPQSYVHTNTCI